jgi:hypothetical protein
LAGEDGNAYSILGRTTKALRDAGADEEYISDYQKRAMNGDYNNLLVVTMGEIEEA